MNGTRIRTRVLILAILLGLVTGSAEARSKFQGDATDGPVSVIKSARPETVATLRTCAGGLMYVYNVGTSTLSTIYSNVAGTAKSNPFTIPTNGRYEFFADAAEYDLRIVGGGCSDHTWTRVGAIGSASSRSVDASTYPSIQAAINAAITLNAAEVLLPCGITTLATKITIPVLASSVALNVRGCPTRGIDQESGTILRATASMTSVLEILSAQHNFFDIRIDAARQATYGIYIQDGYEGSLNRVWVEDALKDGIHFATTGINNGYALNDSYVYGAGTTYATSTIITDYSSLPGATAAITGTAATTATSATITISGSSTDLTTLGLRAGDFVRVGNTMATAYYGRLASVAASTITMQSYLVPQTTASGLQFAIFSGYGVNLTEQADNNVLVVNGGSYRGGSSSSFNIQGLFGVHFTGTLFENGHVAGLSIGRNQGTVAGSSVTCDGCYFESNQSAEIWANNYNNVSIVEPVFESVNPPHDVRPEQVTINPAKGQLVLNGSRAILQSGFEQDFVLEITNDGGVIKHRIVADVLNGGTVVDGANRITGQTSTLTATPTVDAVTAFAGGAGINSGATHRILLHVVDQPNAANFRAGITKVEFNDTGTDLQTYVTKVSGDVNGLTISRTAIAFIENATGAAFTLDTGNILAGEKVSVRFRGLIR